MRQIPHLVSGDSKLDLSLVGYGNYAKTKQVSKYFVTGCRCHTLLNAFDIAMIL